MDPRDTTDDYHDCDIVESSYLDLGASRIQIDVNGNDDVSENFFDDFSEIPFS